jgi:hypothetical protein
MGTWRFRWLKNMDSGLQELKLKRLRQKADNRKNGNLS